MEQREARRGQAGRGEAERAGRIGRVPFDPALKVDTAWDLGIDDYTAIWFFQQTGREVRAIDYFEVSGEGLQSIVRMALAQKPYVFGRHYLPHDVMVRELGAGGRSRCETLSGLGVRPIEVGVAADPEERINASRLMIPVTWFDASACAPGLERLRSYRKRWVAATASCSGPLHDKAVEMDSLLRDMQRLMQVPTVRFQAEPVDLAELAREVAQSLEADRERVRRELPRIY